MFSSERHELRQLFFTTWQKHQDKILLLEPLEKQLLEVILLHPEYNKILSNSKNYEHTDFDESNPFLHMSLHLAIREQINTNRPLGIKEIFHALHQRHQDIHQVEHALMECLANMIWEAQRNKVAPSEECYLAELRDLV